MLERSASAKYAKHVFYSRFNDLDVFIEDTAAESRKIFVQLLRRVLGEEMSLAQIFPIGSKTKVLERCAADQGARERPCVYIVDGDYDQLLGGQATGGLVRLYRLPRYCVENFLVDEDAVVAVLDEEVLDMEHQDIRIRLDFAGWLASISAHLAKFVAGSAVALSRRCGVATVNVPLGQLCSCTSGAVDAALILAKVQQFHQIVDAKHGAGCFAAECAATRGAHGISDSEFVLRFGSGKSLLLPLLRRRLQSLFAFAPNGATFKLRIAMRCDVSELADIRRAIS